MPRKKKEEAVAEVTATETKTTKKASAAKETAEKKAPAKKAPAKKAAESKATEKKAPAKKTAAKKPAEKKAAEKKAPAKKTTAKKAAVKKEEKPVVEKKDVKTYEDIINWKKGEAHAMDWLYIEINANDLLTEVEAGVDNLETVCKAILNCMLEGDGFIVEPSEENKVSRDLTVRYYCDNLSESRRKYFEA